MAAVCLDFFLMYFIFLGNCCFVQGTVKEYSVCEREDAKFKFDRVPDNNTLVAGWFKMARDNVNRTCVLKKHIIASPCIPYVEKASLSPTDNRLTIARIDRSDTGLYLQELDNVNNGENRYQSYLQVTVLVPPKRLPHINATKSSDGKLILTCFEPEFKGIPEVLTQFQDSNGKPQNDLVVTVADSMYKCCLLGDAVRCMGQHDDVCSIYIVKDIEKDTCISCWILIYVSGVIPWFSLLVLRLKCICKKPKEPSRENGKGESVPLTNNGTSIETAGVNTNQTIRKRCKRQYEQMYKTIMMLIANLAIVIILSVYFCRETDDCTSVSLLVTFSGFGTSVVIVGFMAVIKNVSENKRIQKDILNKLLEETVESSDNRQPGAECLEHSLEGDSLFASRNNIGTRTTPPEPSMETTESSGARKTGTLGAERLGSTSSGGIPVSAETENGDRTHFVRVTHGQDKMTPTEEECLEDFVEGDFLLASPVNSNRREIQPPEPSMKTEESSVARKTGTSDAERLSLTSSGGIPVSAETKNGDRTHFVTHGQDRMTPTQESSGAVTVPDEVDLQIGKKEVNDKINEAEPFQDHEQILDLRQNCNRVTRRVTN